MGNGPSCFHSLSPFMETLLEQGSVLTEEEEEMQERGGAAAETLLLAVFSGKDFARSLARSLAVCVPLCVFLPLAKATKASIYLS